MKDYLKVPGVFSFKKVIWGINDFVYSYHLLRSITSHCLENECSVISRTSLRGETQTEPERAVGIERNHLSA